MNASLSLPAVSYVPTLKAERFGKTLLLVNGVIIGSVALVQALLDLSGRFVNLGPTAGGLFENPDALAYFEAHGLALMVAILMLAHRNSDRPTWNWVAAAMHLLLGGSNLLFWDAFTAYGLVPMGIGATAMHAIFFALQVTAAVWRSPELVTGPGATYRIASVLTIATGICLHITRLPLGPERFVAEVFTPLADALFAVPMTIAGLAGLFLWRRAILPTLWDKIAYGFIVVYFLGSIVIHLSTIFTWSTAYTLAFPAWFPLAAVTYLSLIGVFTATRRFTPAAAK